MHFHLEGRANPENMEKKTPNYALVESESSHDSILNFSAGYFELIEVKEVERSNTQLRIPKYYHGKIQFPP